MELAIILSALNESAVISSTLTEAIPDSEFSCGGSGIKWISTVAEQAARARATVCPDNLGSTRSDLNGYRNATGVLIAMVNGDRQYRLSDLPLRLIILDERISAVFGWRKERRDPAIRKLLSRRLSRSSTMVPNQPHHGIIFGLLVAKAGGARSTASVTRANYFGPKLWVQCARWGLKVGARGVSMNRSAGLLLNRSTAFQYLLGLERDLTTVVAGRAKPVRSLRSEPWLRYHHLGEQ